jgi:hypothetical protein
MLLACQGNALIQSLLVGAAHKGNQGADHGIHVLDLNGFEIRETGGDFLILCLPADALQVCDGTA